MDLNLIHPNHEVSLFDESGGNLECVGAIISSYLILSVASCLYGKIQTGLSIMTRGGSGQNSNSNEEEQMRNISRIIFHPNWKNTSSENDLAILVLDQNLPPSPNSNFVPVLAMENGNLEEFNSLHFSGRLCRENSVASSLVVSDPGWCSPSSSSFLFPNDKLCLIPVPSKANANSSEKSSSSSGENCSLPLPGSSLFCADKQGGQFLCGILAVASKNTGENGQMYTNVTHHLKWIESVSAFKIMNIAAAEKIKNKSELLSEKIDDDEDYEVVANIPDFVDAVKKPETAPDGDEYEQAETILGGVKVDYISYQLSLRHQNPGGKWEHICGAVILDESTALTAAHCFHATTYANHYSVVAGESLLDTAEKTEQVREIKKIIIHPDYTNYKSGSDIAILHVDTFRLNRFARGVWLSPFSTQKLTNISAVISGWGQFSNKSISSTFLQQGVVSILSPDDCLQRVEQTWKFSAPKGVLCALAENTRTCRGDSGGPLVIQNYTLGNSVGNLLVGVTSFGAKSCEGSNTVGGFTEISHFYQWIQENRAQNPCGENHLPCVTGGCFHVDGKCDKESDCEDGTDEVNCFDPTSLKSCSVAMKLLPSPRSKNQWIYPHGNATGVEVLCDFDVDGGGWTVIQKRSSGPPNDFDRGWSEYANGFGSLDGNFWLGLENIHALTKNGDQVLRIELEDFKGKKKYAKYSRFSISNASDFYRMSIRGFSGTAGDSMTNLTMPNEILNGMRFSTKDKDNDNNSSGNCAADGRGGWWFNACSLSYLNGIYREKGEKVPLNNGIHWATWTGWESSLAKTEMKIRNRKRTEKTIEF